MFYALTPPFQHWICDRLTDWLAEYEADQDHSEQRAQVGLYQHELRLAGKAQTLAWARAVEIAVQPLPADVWRQAGLHFRHRPNQVGLEAYVRHAFTNYDRLLAELRRRRGAEDAYAVLRTRTDDAVRQALQGRTYAA